MTSSSLLVFAAVLCFAIHSCVGNWSYVANSTGPSAPSKKPCEYKAIKNCNKQFKQVFMVAKAGAGRRKLGFGIGKAVYCTALQTFMHCLRQSLSDCPGGAWLPQYSFVVLEHGVMDKKCGVCPGHQYGDLEIALNANSKPDYVGTDNCPRCAKAVHNKCVNRFLKKLSRDSNMCRDIQEFISCYKEEGDPRKPCAAERIVKRFSNLCRQLGEKMLKEDQIHPGLMC